MLAEREKAKIEYIQGSHDKIPTKTYPYFQYLYCSIYQKIEVTR